jgi:HK97 family phage major capsid protein
MKLKDLQERRSRTVQQMREITDNPKGDNGDLTDQQQQQFDELRGQVERLEKDIERQQAIDEAERRMQGQQVSGTGDQQFDRMRRDFSIVRALAGAAGLAGVDDGREREVQQEIRNRTGRTFQGVAVPSEVFEEPVEERVLTSGGNGSDLIATDHLGGQFVDRLREAVVVRRLGARVLRNLQGNVDIPKLSASATSEWVAENGGLSTSDHNFTSVTMSPKHAGAITELSRNMLQQASPDVEQLARQDFAQILAAALDRVAISGGGSNEPDGILQTASANSVDMSGGVTWAKVQDVIGQVEDADSMGTAFLTHPKVGRVLRTTNKVSSEPEHGFIQTDRNSLDGYPLARTTLVPTSGSPLTSELIFGRFSDLLVGFWSELDLLVNPFESTAYSKGNVQVRAMMTCDIALRHPESFAYGTGIDVA